MTLALPITIAIVFYLLLPGIGALITRRRWRQFRRGIISASLLTPLSQKSEEGRRYRFFGTLEAIERGSRIWLRGNQMSVGVEMSRGSVVVLPSGEDVAGVKYAAGIALENDQDTGAQLVRWEELSILPEGTHVFVSGVLSKEQGHRVLRGERGGPLVAVAFDGNRRTFLRRAVLTGRHQNEYWNSATPFSVAAGSVVNGLIAYRAISSFAPPWTQLVAVIAALLPVVPFLPPGLLLFLLYRRWWRIGRRCRALRDIVGLPGRFLDEQGEGGCDLPGGGRYLHRVVDGIDDERLDALGFDLRLSRTNREPRIRHLYGVESESSSVPVQGSDPMVELVALVAPPLEESGRYRRRARVAEVSSVLCMAGAATLNSFAVVPALARLLF